MPGLPVTNARLDELPEIFRLLFSHLTPGEQEARLHDALSLVDDGSVDPEGIFVVRDRAGVRGAVVAITLRGAGAVFWTPVVKEGAEQDVLEDQLLQTGCHWLRQRGAKVAHALLYVDETRFGAALLRNGFARITRLQYLQLSLSDASGVLASTKLALRTYADAPRLFSQTLEQTYEASLDCPELNGLRTIDEIIDGHKGQGVFDPERWWLACRAEQPVGVLMIADTPAWRSWDISYVGVVPAARRTGIARTLIQLASERARSAGVEQLTVAVDTRNQPAWNLYAELGFQPGEQREVYLKIF